MKKPFVAILMGSDSDLPVMKEAAEVLEQFGVIPEVVVASAHRTPARVFSYVKKAPARGVRVIIAGAGGAAHLAGVVAALTTLPVIGVPIKTSTAKGIDSLFAMAQMPPGVPVATVAINGGKNAGLLAVSMLALSDKKLAAKLVSYRRRQAKEVLAKAERLEKQGFRKYLASK
jgi:5-(carboxyamino)imidazole ribonucleotide mutase